MADSKQLSASIVEPSNGMPSDVGAAQSAQPDTPPQPPPESLPPIHEVIGKGSDDEICGRFGKEVVLISDKCGKILDRYHCLGLLEPTDSIDKLDLDRVYQSLRSDAEPKSKDVMLILLSRGGSVEHAYQISKLCQGFSKDKFIAVVPRQAKSAATLIALGADEIHMGLLGQLGPIDPQLDGLPALAVNQALQTIASLSEKYPRSANMFAAYLQRALTVEQIGYCHRISQSAEQYAVRLLARKKVLSRNPATIAKELVHEYKDHSFVIDLDEAKEHLGPEWVKTHTEELEFAEQVYTLLEFFNLFLAAFKKQRLLVLGSLQHGAMILKNE